MEKYTLQFNNKAKALNDNQLKKAIEQLISSKKGTVIIPKQNIAYLYVLAIAKEKNVALSNFTIIENGEKFNINKNFTLSHVNKPDIELRSIFLDIENLVDVILDYEEKSCI